MGENTSKGIGERHSMVWVGTAVNCWCYSNKTKAKQEVSDKTGQVGKCWIKEGGICHIKGPRFLSFSQKKVSFKDKSGIVRFTL